MAWNGTVSPIQARSLSDMKEVFLRNRWLADLESGDFDQGIAVTHFPALVGRSSHCDYVINHPLISRRHCSFELRDGQISVQDLGSLNGTYLNGERIDGPQLLHDADRLDLAFLPYEVCLPLSSEGSVVQPGPLAEASLVDGRPREVLVVDDNADAAQTLAVLLAQWGHHVHVAHDGSAAIQAARVHQPDTVFLDIRLAGADGFQVARQLRKEAGMDKAVLVGITGYDPADTLGRSRQSGFQCLLTKPVAAEALQEVFSHSA
jgi:CheY-like chemotaxis protein